MQSKYLTKHYTTDEEKRQTATHEFGDNFSNDSLPPVPQAKKIAIYILYFTFLCICLLPSPYVSRLPGPTDNVMEMIGDDEHSGKLLLTTVSVTGGKGNYAPILNSLYGWLNPQASILPSEAIYPIGQTKESIKQKSSEDMVESENSAITAARNYLKTAEDANINTDDISIDAGDTGGPSAGQMFALGIIEKYGTTDIVNGRTIAGTGTISPEGEIGAIGGIPQKMIGAKRDGATIFLAPKSNCNEVIGNTPEGLQVFAVEKIEDSISILRGESTASCSE